MRELVQNWHDGLLSSLPPEIYDRQKMTISRSQTTSHRRSRYSAGQRGELGLLEYNEDSQCLTLVNYNTALHRKVLLLGYSKKSNHHDIIGQFGELQSLLFRAQML